MPTQTKENYLKAAYLLSLKDSDVSITDLSRELGVSKPTANDMVKKMQSKGWVIYERYKPLRLTTEGIRTAALIVRKHRLSEMFLVDVMGFGWEEVHHIAEELEHITELRFFDRMDEILGYPSHDPHGSPIPDKNGHVTREDLPALSEVEVGQVVVFRSIQDNSQKLLNFLNNKNLQLGTKIKVVQKEPFDQSVVVSYGSIESETFSHQVTQRLLVQILESTTQA